MRYIIFFLVFVPMLLNAQGFSNKYKLNLPSLFGMAIVEKDGNYYTIGLASDSVSNRRITVFSSFNSSGQVILSKVNREQGGDVEPSACLKNTSDGGYASTGTFYKQGQGLGGTFTKYDSTGNVEWFRKYFKDSTIQYFRLSDVSESEDRSGYYLVGTIQYGNYVSSLVLIRTDSLGNEQWRKQYSGKWSLDGKRIDRKGSGFIVSGVDNNYSFGTNNDQIKPYMMEVDSSGTIIWKWTYNSDTRTGVSYTGIRTEDGGYILSGYKIIEQKPSSGDILTLPCVMKVDSNRNEVWKMTTGNFSEDNSADQFFTYALRVGDKLILCGTSIYQFNLGGRRNNYGLLATISLNGDSIWAKAYSLTKDTSNSFPNFNIFHGLVPNADGGFTLAGESLQLFSSGTGQQLWLMRTDSNGCITPTDCGVTKEVTGIDRAWVGVEFLLYPNPANDEVHIQLSEAKADGYTISDLSGRVVMQDKMEEGEAVVQTGNLHAGVYVVSVQAEGRILGMKRLVVE
jgi:hypothetical protein